MTWASKSALRTFQSAGTYLKREVWVWPIIAVVLLSVVGVAVRGAIARTMRDSLRSELETLRDVEVAMLRTWLDGQQRNAESLANSASIRELAHKALTGDAEAAEEISKALAPAMSSYAYDGFYVVDKQTQVAASHDPSARGRGEFAEHEALREFFAKVFSGRSGVSRPVGSAFAIKDHLGRTRSGTPVMYVAAPIRDDDFQAIGVLALRMRPDQEFTRILQLGRLGDSGETYAFDAEGLMLSESRFDEDMILLGLLPDEEGSRSILRLLVRDPGGDITAGFRPAVRRAELPLTRMVAAAVAGGSGSDVEGYRDYRGVPQVGAWSWLPEYGFGVATEMDLAEAYRPLTILQRTFWGLFALLALTSVAIFLFTLQVARLRREAQEAAIEAQQLGQYKLEHKIGAGAMGIVYKARHAMLRRPTAVKMIEPQKVTPEALAAFEREVQITSQLCHPSTVQIFDYGRTPEGLFYYAMEFLDGLSLQDLVDRHGPLPVGRVVDILQQVCGSLYEAHSEGLVHRDVKPANIMLNRRGAAPDVVKVLDFGLVKDLGEGAVGGLAGTPLYMSPEAIQTPTQVDGRSDLYGVGAVGYFLLTGRTVFDADNLPELLSRHLNDEPTAPSIARGEPLPDELEDTLLACLDKNRAKRPQTARDLATRLARVPDVDGWNLERADLWWNQYERGTLGAAGGAQVGGPAVPAEKGAPATRRGDGAATIAH